MAEHHKSDDVNVFPLNDLQEHITDGAAGITCPCNPTVTVEGSSLVIVHNAFDHREIVEQAIEVMNGDNVDDQPITESPDDTA